MAVAEESMPTLCVLVIFLLIFIIIPRKPMAICAFSLQLHLFGILFYT